MNQLVNANPAATFGDLAFRSVIRTDITLEDGGRAAILTLLTHPVMLDSAVMGIGRGLISGCISESWQHETFALVNGELHLSSSYAPTYAAKCTPTNKAFWTSEYTKELRDKLIEAHTKIAGLCYLLEQAGITIPDHLK
ncbi:MAG: hypothetical protein HDS85_05845 [Bacteroidales bacterium]|nr:hypothetical protein [Bacteroidales bacterium]